MPNGKERILELNLTPIRPVLIVAVVLAIVPAFVPFTVVAAGIDANNVIEACRSFMDGVVVFTPCA